MHDQIEPEILAGFITESNELIEAVDQDLVRLEHAPDDPELLNNIFRAMHTIKGSGSFLGLDELTGMTHAAEDALNALRKGQAKLTPETMDLLLLAVDVVRRQLDDLASDRALESATPQLVQDLRQIGAGADTDQDVAPASTSAPEPEPQASHSQRLDLSDSKLELLPFMIEDLVQSLSKLFSRYPRVIRDLARSTDKQIDLQITGGDTEVDKSVLEGLGDPLVHILRNSADHGIESPDQRQAAGKDPTGVIRLSAQHEGNHVLVRIVDDGTGIDPQRIGAKVIERGMVTPEELKSMTKANILQFIFAPGSSTIEQVSDLSGRGVGMDLVRTNLAKLNGMVDVDSTPGKGTTVSLKIPLTVAIMPVMMVAVADELYAVPLSNILEIVRPEQKQVTTIGGERVLKLRDQVLPVLDLREQFDCAVSSDDSSFAVVVGLGELKVALLVERLIGQREVVIKPLDDMFDQTGAISGAMVREDGGVSLIVDVAGMLKSVKGSTRAAA